MKKMKKDVRILMASKVVSRYTAVSLLLFTITLALLQLQSSLKLSGKNERERERERRTEVAINPVPFYWRFVEKEDPKLED